MFERFGDYFLYKGHFLKAKPGEWGIADAISEFEADSKPFVCDTSVSHISQELIEKSDKVQKAQWKQIREELGIDKEKKNEEDTNTIQARV